ncbi:hypothetical protein BDK51DRAFT_45533 [Blyttiomyces helicus]|uniref:Uncharacterized protein n=1 Tax=Blyttiomyces helicus TaxID=388810 RepID=A0A4P9VV77_9FUNG|nr:hypothetical protein BDK51DRAFT_45533 [Blyttiomyces helicus]|eukprot:RKO82705.1 hypothetical protein BDK51DRAFT_45533 [Blyttiomyces helicus]
MFSRVLCAVVALGAAAAPLTFAQVYDRPDAVYQAFADRITGFIAANGCGGDTARNPETGRVLPALWLRPEQILHDWSSQEGTDAAFIRSFRISN